MHFKLTETGDLELEELNCGLRDALSEALPRVYAAREELFDAQNEENCDQWKERMKIAVNNEHAREYPCNAEKACSSGLGYDSFLKQGAEK